MTTAAIYCRISRDREGRELGVQRQEQDCRELAERLGATVVEVLTDNDISASTKGRKPRPAYAALLDGARAGRWSLIVAWSSSRLTRRPMELEEQIQLAEQHGVRYAYLKSPSFDLDTAAGRAIARTMAAWDAAEAEQTSERLAAQKRQTAQSGRYRGGRRSYGFEPDGVTLVPDEAERIRWATRQVLLGASIRSVARQWRGEGLRTSAGREWSPNGVRRLLLRARNAGLVVYRGEVVAEAVWPPIVSRTEWEAVCRLLADPRRRTQTSTAPRWLGSGVFVCGACGAAMTTGTATTRQGCLVRTYICPARHTQVGRHVSRRAQLVDETVEAVMVERLSRPDMAEVLAERLPEVDAEALETRATELRERMNEAADMYAAGVWDRRHVERVTATVRAELDEVEGQLTRSVVDHPAAELLGAEDIAEAWRALDLSRRQAIVQALATVTLMPGRMGRPAGWRPGQPHFDPTSVRIDWHHSTE